MKYLNFLFILVVFLSGGCSQPPDRMDGIINTTKEVQSTQFRPIPEKTETLMVSPTALDSTTETEQVGLYATNSTVLPTEATVTETDLNIEWPSPCDSQICFFDFQSIFINPIPAGFEQNIESTYRYGSTQGGQRIPHDGVEFYNPSGTPVLSVGDGKVLFSGNDNEQQWGQYLNFYGEVIIIQHAVKINNLPVYTLYAHLSEREVQTGDSVIAGQEIGKVGLTGSAIGSHLHFEVRVGDPTLNATRNPEFFLPLIPETPNMKTGILVGTTAPSDRSGIEDNIVLQPVISGKIEPNKTIFLEPYAFNTPSIAHWQEDFLISDIPAGDYRLTTFINDQLFEQMITIKENKITFIQINTED